MEVTVKTLDSQTKTFNLSLETTVKEFKTKIADEMNIPIEKQRLIFQGKVLQDEKSLQEYKVNGCVVHLVERQPPRATRSNGQSTETTTSSTSTTASPGNMFMGAFAVPVDVMGVTQQIVQGIVQQIGAESAQANISTTSSDDGSSVNVHINLSTVMARNDVRSRIAPARVHLNNVSRIISRLQNDGLPSGRDLNEENSNTETGRQTGNDGSENNNNNNGSALGDLADVLQQVVRLNDEIRPHLERYQELLRSGADRELRSADDLLPDLAAEALHSLSHAYHALSDVTTNFRVPEPRLNVLPSMSPIPVPAAHPRFQDASPSGSQSQPPSSSSSQTTTGTPTGIPFGIGLRPGGGLGTGIGLRTGRGLGPFTLRPGVTLRPGAATFGSRSGIPAGIGLIPTSAGLGGIPGGLGLGGIPAGTVLGTPAGTVVGTPAGNVVGTPATSVPSTNASPATSTATGNVPRPQQNPLAGLPINLRNLPNFAVQFNPAAGNITIAHIVTTVVEETSLRTTTTTTNSTPSPRTSSWGSNPASDNQVTPTPRSDTPMSQDDTPTPPSGNPSTQGGDPSARIINPTSEENPAASQSGTQGDSNPQDSSMNVDQPPNTSASSSSSSSSHSNGQPPSNGQAADTPRDAAVVNFMPQNTNHRDPLLPCQSFHFASLVPRRGQTAPLRRSEPAGQTGDGPRETPAAGNGSVPEMFDLAHLVNISQQRAAEQRAAAAAASGGNTNGVEGNPFLELLIPTGQETSGARNPSEEVMMHMAAQTDERRRTMTPEELAEERADVEQQGTLSRFLLRLLETIPLSQLLMTVLAGTGDPYALSGSMTQAFLREDILRGGEATPENLQRATERILEELEEIFQSSFASCNVKENIDAPATLLTYLRPKIRRLLEIINSSDVDSVYVLEISSLISRMSVELVALTQYCLQDGRTGMEIALRRSVASSPAIAALDPNVRSMVIDTMWACIQDLGNDESLRESTLMPFVVRKEKRKAKKTESPSPKMDRKEEKKKESSNSKRSSDTPRTSAGSSPSSSRRTRSSSQPENVPMETDESWKKVIPAEWVPVISQDIIRQQRMPRQAPFSDAYLNGMPPKRRKIQQPNEPAPYNQCVSATLKRSITKAGVTPKTDLEKLNEEANSSQSLERVFEDEVKSEVRKRLATDTDYNSEKFPSIHKYFEKDEKR